MDPSDWPIWQRILVALLILCTVMLLASWITWRVKIGTKKKGVQEEQPRRERFN